MDQPGNVANPARGQLNRENEYFPVLVRALEFRRVHKMMLEGTFSRSSSIQQNEQSQTHHAPGTRVHKIMLDGTFPAVLLAYNRANTNSRTHHAACKKPLHIVMLEGTFLLHSSRTHTSQPMQQEHSTALYTLCMGPVSYQIGCKLYDGPEPSSKCLLRQTNIPQAQRCTIT